MGLCKCPKKKVTNLFCFEHRVNVCEHCLVANHSRCIVQSYLQWLQDSDYRPVCSLCGKKLSDDDSGECIRLVCYDVFHWHCLNHYAQKFPANTAPAGYTCPSCKQGIFPPNNLVSPVAETLTKMLSTVNWARTGLGLPLIEENKQKTKSLENLAGSSTSQSGVTPTGVGVSISSTVAATAGSAQHTRPSAQISPYSTTTTVIPSTSEGSTIISVDAGTTVRGQKGFSVDPRKLFDSTKDYILNVSHDHDEDKYKRRPALSWLSRWFKNTEVKKRRDPNSTLKKFLVVLLIGLIGFITVVVIFSRVGRDMADHDPLLDPQANPNIHVNQMGAVNAD